MPLSAEVMTWASSRAELATNPIMPATGSLHTVPQDDLQSGSRGYRFRRPNLSDRTCLTGPWRHA